MREASLAPKSAAVCEGIYRYCAASSCRFAHHLDSFVFDEFVECVAKVMGIKASESYTWRCGRHRTIGEFCLDLTVQDGVLLIE